MEKTDINRLKELQTMKVRNKYAQEELDRLEKMVQGVDPESLPMPTWLKREEVDKKQSKVVI